MKKIVILIFSAALLLLLYSTWATAQQESRKATQGTRAPQASARSHQPLKRYRVIFNQDSYGFVDRAEGDLEKYIQNTFGFLGNTPVDAYFWMDGAGGNTASYDSKVLELTGQRIGKVSPSLRKMIDEGHDPPKVIAREGKKRGLDVFWSFRINDIHDSFLPEERPTYKVQHPEWLIGKQPYGFDTALNFAIPEVRRIKFAAIQEFFDKYDFDGLEIDFLRGPPFFIPGEEPKNTPILTQLLRNVRQHLNRRGEERGRPIRLAARVGENLQECRLDGFDVATWVKEGLIDYLIVGAGFINVDVEAFKRLAKGTGVLVYAEIYGYPGGYKQPGNEGVLRALALNLWHQGADGIYLYNWGPSDLLKEIGDPKQMRFKPVTYVPGRGAPGKEYPHNCMDCVLPVSLTEGLVVKVPVLVGEDLAAAARQRSPAQLELRVECDNLAAEDKLDISLNDKLLTAERRDKSILVTTLNAQDVKLGMNHVTLRIAQRDPQAKGMIPVKAVEIHVSYK